MSTTVDHVVITVRDLETARRELDQLGFALSPVGSHPALGTRNTLIVFPRVYLELLSLPEPPNEATATAHRALEEFGPGISAIALSSADPRADARRIAQGAGTPPVYRIVRPVPEIAAGAEAVFDIVLPPKYGKLAPDFFFCHHGTPHYIWGPHLGPHANGCANLRELTIGVPSPAAVAPYIATLWEEAAFSKGQHSTTFGNSHFQLAVLDELSLQEQLPAPLRAGGPLQRRGIITICAGSLERLMHYLTLTDTPYEQVGGALMFAPLSEIRGLVLRAIEAQ